MTVYHAISPQHTQEIASILAQQTKKGAVLAFFGNLGAGKTTFIRSFVEYFDIPSTAVCSPTFQYLNIYSGTLPIYHFDLYRLQSAADFIELGFDEFFSSDGIVCIEWAERIEKILPKNSVIIRLEHSFDKPDTLDSKSFQDETRYIHIGAQ